jgi:hypothetical protein
MKNTLIIFSLFFLTSIFSQNEFKDLEKENYSISYPKSWNLDTSGQMNTEFLLFSESTENDTFNENVNLLIQDLKGHNITTLESFTELSISQIKTMIKEGKVLENYNKKTHHILIWSGYIGDNHLKFKQFFFVKNEKAYVLTFTTLINTFDKYHKTGNKILNSFTLK